MTNLSIQLLVVLILVNFIPFQSVFADDDDSSDTASAGCSSPKLPNNLRTDEMKLMTINVTDSRFANSVIERHFYIRVPGTDKEVWVDHKLCIDAAKIMVQTVYLLLEAQPPPRQLIFKTFFKHHNLEKSETSQTALLVVGPVHSPPSFDSYKILPLKLITEHSFPQILCIVKL